MLGIRQSLSKEDTDKIISSGLFDSEWYKNTYPDVNISGLSPLVHFLKVGYRLDRDPGPRFCGKDYLTANPDVLAANVSPILHYLTNGIQEGRAQRPSMEIHKTEAQADIVEIIIPVHNALADTKLLLASIESAKNSQHIQIHLVNDCSNEETAEWLKNKAELCGWNYIDNSSQLGYAGSVNEGIKRTRSRYICVLNSDTEVNDGWIDRLVYAARKSDAAIVGPFSNAAGYQTIDNIEKNSRNLECRNIISRYLLQSEPGYIELPSVNGFCMLILREVFERIGYFDNVHFPKGYGEETDFCIRAHNAGYKIVVDTKSYVFHAKSKSFGHLDRIALTERADKVLREKWGNAKIDSVVRGLESNSKLSDFLLAAEKHMALQSHDQIGRHCEIGHVAFIASVGPGGGGAQSMVQEATSLSRLGINVSIFAPPQYVGSYINAYGINEENPQIVRSIEELDAANLHVAIATNWQSLSIATKAKEQNSEIVLGYYVQDYESMFYERGSKEWMAAEETYVSKAVDFMFVKSHWLQDEIYAKAARNAHIIPPSLDRSIFYATQKKRSQKLRVALMVRPNTPWRGPKKAIELAKRLKEVAAFEVNIFGCAPEESDISELNAASDVIVHGKLERVQVAQLLRSMDVFVDTSIYQAFGRTALEAMSCGCVPIAPAIGGPKEFIINEFNGYCVDANNVNDLFALLMSLTTDEAKLTALRKNALMTASKYNLNDAAARLYQLIETECVKAKNADSSSDSKPGVPEQWPTLEALNLDPIKKLPLKVLVVAWDIGHNPLGRAYMLAETIERCVRSVTLIGFQNERYGKDVWEPVRKGRLPVIPMRGQLLPDLISQCEEISTRYKPDLVVACKPRLPSLQLAMEFKAAWNCPIVFDVDDHELAFFKDKPPLPLNQVNLNTALEFPDLAEPYGELWTRMAETMVPWADGIIVSNRALGERFGGLVVPHVRDEREFDPRKFDKKSLRAEYGIPENETILLFFGTPRLHKGLDKLAEYVGKSNDEKLKLLVVGTPPDRSVTSKLKDLSRGKLIMLPNQPFGDVPRILSLADLVCLPQDPSNPISKYQLPAKAIDAVAMNVPLFTTGTPPLMQLIEDKVAIEVDYNDIGAAIDDYLTGKVPVDTAVERRRKFLLHYCYDASARSLRDYLSEAVKKGKKRGVPEAYLEFKKFQRSIFNSPAQSKPGKTDEVSSSNVGTDVILLWKQNDSGLYGRRNDMVAKYLASRSDVKRVFVIDSPLNEHDLERMKHRGLGLTQDRNIYVESLRKVLGECDSEKIIYGVYLYPAGKFQSIKLEPDRPPLFEGFQEFLTQFFKKHEIDPKRSIFWVYPRHFEVPAIISHFKPMRVVADIVDDHRAWPGVTESERTRLTENYSDIIGCADFHLVNCLPMQEAMAEFKVTPELIPNGCDENPTAIEPAYNQIYDEIKAFPGKVIGFVGNLEKKIDLELLDRVASDFPDCLMVLAGSTHAYPEVHGLLRHKNVRMPGVVPYEYVGSWIKHFDVALIPHRKMDMTQFMNPLKLFVYLSWRVPVVSTEIYNVDRVDGLIAFGASHDEFIENLRTSLDSGGHAAAKFDKYIAENSWAARLMDFVDRVMTVH